MNHEITFISINCEGEEREFSYTPDNLMDEYYGECDLPDLEDTIVSCIFAGVHLYFETFSELVRTFLGSDSERFH